MPRPELRPEAPTLTEGRPIEQEFAVVVAALLAGRVDGQQAVASLTATHNGRIDRLADGLHTWREDAMRYQAERDEVREQRDEAERTIESVLDERDEWRRVAAEQTRMERDRADALAAQIARVQEVRLFTVEEVIEIANETSDSLGNLYRLDFIDRIRHEALSPAEATEGGEGA